jgi:D-proline reductase (dithiol) PrdB
MCHQTVGLIQGFIEAEGIPTVSLSLLREVTGRVRPPRALFVPRPMGYPLGEPGRPDLQESILLAALALLSRVEAGPILEEFPPGG